MPTTSPLSISTTDLRLAISFTSRFATPKPKPCLLHSAYIYVATSQSLRAPLSLPPAERGFATNNLLPILAIVRLATPPSDTIAEHHFVAKLMRAPRCAVAANALFAVFTSKFAFAPSRLITLSTYDATTSACAQNKAIVFSACSLTAC